MKTIVLIILLGLLTSFNPVPHSSIELARWKGNLTYGVLINMYGYQSYSFDFTLLNMEDGKCYHGSWVAGQGFYYTELKAVE